MIPLINSPGNEIAPNTLLVIPNEGITNEQVSELLKPLKGVAKRDWFNSHFYYCLPLTIGNQYGFAVTAEQDFSVTWNGNNDLPDLQVEIGPQKLQIINSHFGCGIITVQCLWHYRTPPYVNLMTIAPPNVPQHNIMHMVGVVETDNLRRDFTFNLKMTAPGTVSFKKGDIIGAFIPVPRYFSDTFTVQFGNEILSPEAIQQEYEAGAEFMRLRNGEDTTKNHLAGRLYFKGEDAFGNKFPDHQRN